PDGFELLMFDEAMGADNPDYAPSKLKSRAALVKTGILLLLIVAGSIRVYLDRKRWQLWCLDHRWSLAGLAAIALCTALVMVTQRPRPSYLLPAAPVLFVLIGVCIWALISRVPTRPWLARLFPVTVALVIIATPPYYPRVLGPKPT